ncbi:hypothetical protein K0M31_015244, partial [Melipona bicolor]
SPEEQTCPNPNLRAKQEHSYISIWVSTRTKSISSKVRLRQIYDPNGSKTKLNSELNFNPTETSKRTFGQR